MEKSKKIHRGFTLLEVVVAVFIVSVALVAALTLINTSLISARSGGNKLIAANLAQEGLEIARNIRDSSGQEWTGWHQNTVSGNYRAQYNSASFLLYNNTPLRLNPTSGVYSYDSGNNTLFYRRINLNKRSNEQMRVVSEVIWQERGRNQNVTVEGDLWDWK